MVVFSISIFILTLALYAVIAIVHHYQYTKSQYANQSTTIALPPTDPATPAVATPTDLNGLDTPDTTPTTTPGTTPTTTPDTTPTTTPDTTPTTTPDTTPTTTPGTPQLPTVAEIAASDKKQNKDDIISNVVGAIGQEVINQSVRVMANTIPETAVSRSMNTAILNAEKKFLPDVVKNFEKNTAKMASKILDDIAAKSSKTLVQLGIKAAQVGEDAATDALIKTAESAMIDTGAEAGAELATAGTEIATLGPVGLALAAFSIMTMGLDMGDAGGYEKMGSIKTYTKIKNKLNAQMKAQLDDNKSLSPLVFGPIDKLSQDDRSSKIQDAISAIMADSANPIVAPMLAKIQTDIRAGTLLEADIDDETKMAPYYAMIDNDALNSAANNKVCILLGGKLVTQSDKTTACSYADADSCNKSYNWPLNKGDIYAEYKTDQYGGACIVASATLRQVCTSNKLGYDADKGMCTGIDENYCKTKGADWRYDSDLKQYDCGINLGQDISEHIFGKTLVRGLKQIFDPAQYEPCKKGETDDGYFCRSVSCADGEEQSGGLCYKSCKPNYTSNKITMCWQNCSRYGTIKINGQCFDLSGNNRDNGTKIQLYSCNGSVAQKWLFNTKDGSISLWDNPSKCFDVSDIKSGNQIQIWDRNGTDAQQFMFDLDKRTISPISNLDLCFDGSDGKLTLQSRSGSINQTIEMSQSNDDGANCSIGMPSRPADCPSGFTNTGTQCARSADSKSSSVGGKGPYEAAACKDAGYTNMGLTCFRGYDSFTRDSYNCVGKQCINPCKAKYAYDGDSNPCSKDGLGARAYPSCNAQAKQKGFATWQDYHSGGAFCARDASTKSGGTDAMDCTNPDYPNKKGGLCYIDCAKKYGDGYYNNGTSCWKDAALNYNFSCSGEDEHLVGVRCYKKSPSGFTNIGEILSMKRDTYDRGIGTPAVHIYAKKRAVAYSTKKN